MYVRDAISLAQEWVDQEAARLPHFVGAHLMGSVATLSADTPFPPYRDIDLNVVVAGTRAVEVHDIPYRGRLLEYGLLGWQAYASAEAVLSSPELAPNLVAPTILADPWGRLGPLQRVVAQEFTQRRWVVARCAGMRRAVDQLLATLPTTATRGGAYFGLVRLVVDLAGAVALAALRPPTHRRALIVQHELLAQHDVLPLHEAALDVLGVAHFDADRAESYLGAAAAAFDRAVTVRRTPIPYGFKLQAHVRPYMLEGSQEMISAGYPREAMIWIAGTLVLANQTIQLDAPAEERPVFQASVDQLLDEAGLRAPGALAGRRAAAAQLAGEMAALVERLIATNPAIRDT